MEIELEGSLLENDPERFQQHVRRAYTACAQAVHEELARQQPAVARQNGTSQQAQAGRNNSGQSARRNGTTPRKATHSQVRAIEAIADRQGIDLAALLESRHSAVDPADLTIAQASQLIDELKSTANGAGGQR